MSLDLTYPHVETGAGRPPRLKRVPRVRIAQVAMEYLAHGWSAEEMCRQHPYLTPAEVHAVLGYCFDHQDEVDAEIRAEWEQTEKERAARPRSPFFTRMRAKGLV